MALPGWLAALAVPGAAGEQVQPAGVDLRVGEVYRFSGPGALSVDGRELPAVERVEAAGGAWELRPGAYKVVFMDVVEVPAWAVGLCFPRSSLVRSGVLMGCAVWDPGYRGRGEALLVVANPAGFRLGVGARVAQLVFLSLRGFGGSYSGAYQGERLGG